MKDQFVDHNSLSDQDFEDAFENCTLPPQLFSHEAHLRLAWIKIKKYGLQDAESIIQNQLEAYVKHHGAQDKYHVTLTVAAVKIVDHFMQRSTTKEFNELLVEFPRLKNNFKELILSHYKGDVFNSDEARSVYLEPTIQSF